jgi:hypothetical protein
MVQGQPPGVKAYRAIEVKVNVQGHKTTGSRSNTGPKRGIILMIIPNMSRTSVGEIAGGHVKVCVGVLKIANEQQQEAVWCRSECKEECSIFKFSCS